MRNSSAHNIIQKLVDLIFPPSKRTLRIRETRPEELELLASWRQPERSFIKAVCDYRDELVRDIVYATKFNGTKEACRLIGQVMQPELLAICQEERIFARNITLVPIPLSDKRRRKRGFNQSKRICDAIVAEDADENFHTVSLLEKRRQTADQTELSKTERRKNVRDAFTAKKCTVDAGAIFIIDDVVTTGATLTEARRALKEITDAKIIGVAFAH